MSLTLETQPGFTETPDTSFASGMPATSAIMTALNEAAKFGVVRNEQFFGYYANGETVVLPVSPVDGYSYARSELLYGYSVYWSGSATGPCAGTETPPARGATTGQGMLLQFGYLVDPATGLVTCNASYYKTSQMDTNDGILYIVTHAQRSR